MVAAFHSITGVERRSQLFMTGGVRAGIGSEAQDVQVQVLSNA